MYRSAELDEAEELNDGDPAELGRQYAQHRHIAEIADSCAGLFSC